MHTVRARVNSLDRLATSTVTDPTVALRLRLIEHRAAMLREVIEQDKAITAELTTLVEETRSPLTGLVGIARRTPAEIIVEVVDIRRFAEAGFARFNGTAPIPASSGRAPARPFDIASRPFDTASRAEGISTAQRRIHRIAMIKLRFEPCASAIHDQARAKGHTRQEAMRVLKRHLSNAIYRTMLRDARNLGS